MIEGASVAGAGSLVVLLSPVLPGLLPAEAVVVLKAADAVYVSDGIDAEVVRSLTAKQAPRPAELVAQAARMPVVLVADDPSDRGVQALAEAGVRVLEAEIPPLLRAVEVVDRLRSPGGCPWDAEQTHDSLRRYLVEETYELLDAIETGDRAALLEELGDVLLQVIFHARVAAEDADEPFDIGDVADELVDKLVGRHPHVFADGEKIHTAERQQHRWEELKQAEKGRESVVDGVALGQPAAALAAKLSQRTGRAGLPAELFPQGEAVGERLFRVAADAVRGGVEPEGELRAVAKRFASAVRAAEAAARADGVDPSAMDPDAWRRYWTAT